MTTNFFELDKFFNLFNFGINYLNPLNELPFYCLKTEKTSNKFNVPIQK